MAPRRWTWGDPVDRLVETLAGGGVLAIPTESSYGLAVDPLDSAGVDRIFELKGRDRSRPLPVVGTDRRQIAGLGVDLDLPGVGVLSDLWPAPLTLVLPLLRPVAAAAGGDTLAVRVPAHRRLRELLVDLGHPLTATSANRTGGPPVLEPDQAADLVAETGGAVVDDGRLRGGPPSTMVTWRDGSWALLREGRFPVAELPVQLVTTSS